MTDWVGQRDDIEGVTVQHEEAAAFAAGAEAHVTGRLAVGTATGTTDETRVDQWCPPELDGLPVPVVDDQRYVPKPVEPAEPRNVVARLARPAATD